MTAASSFETSPGPRDGMAALSGERIFTADLDLPGLAHAALARSPWPHARIRSIDTAAARCMPGVIAVVTAVDHTGPFDTYGFWIQDQPLLARDRVRHVGDIVAAVVAETQQAAFQALDALVIAYEPLPVVGSIADALAPDAPRLFDRPSRSGVPAHGAGVRAAAEPAANVLYEFEFAHGDLAAEFARADHLFEDSFSFSRMAHLQMEPLVTLARWTRGQVEIWTGNQDPFLLRADIAELFGLAEAAVRVHVGYVGGSFGARSMCKLEPLTVLLARVAKRPVRLALTMDESFLSLSQHGARITLRTAVSKDGILIARDARILLDAGAYADASALVADKAGYRAAGPYRWRAVHSLARAVRTNTTPSGSFRGFGGTQTSWASESQIDMIARRIGVDPIAFRRLNLLRPGEAYAPGDRPIDTDIVAGMDAVLERMGPKANPPDCGPIRRGRGFAIGFKDAGGQGRYAQARIKLSGDGSATVNCGTVEIGQNAYPAYAQIVAEILRLPLDKIHAAMIDTASTPYDQGTHASYGTVVMGTAIQRAAEDARDKLLAFLGQSLGRDPAMLTLDRDWTVTAVGRPHPISTLVARYFGAAGAEFIGEGAFKAPWDAAAPLNAKILYWMFHFCAADVSVDIETGRVVVDKLVTGADVGRALSPAACHGQLVGASLQGLGQALFEQLQFSDGQLLNATPFLYRAPRAGDLPSVFESVILEQGHGSGPFGAKGVGEAGILGVAAAVANAIADATGARLTALPLTPQRVLAALDQPIGRQEGAAP